MISFAVLEHVPAPDRVLGALARSLRPGGVAALHAPFGHDAIEMPQHLETNWVRFGRTRNWPMYLSGGGLDPIGIELLYKKVSAARLPLRRLRFLFWELTGLHVVRVPRA